MITHTQMSVTQQQTVAHPTSSDLASPITVSPHADWMQHVEYLIPIFHLFLTCSKITLPSILSMCVIPRRCTYRIATGMKYRCHNRTLSMCIINHGVLQRESVHSNAIQFLERIILAI